MPPPKSPVSTNRRSGGWSRAFATRDGWQRSHRIVWSLRKTEFYQLISQARPPGPGANAPFERWEILDPRHNGQLLPKSAVTAADRSMHLGSHPAITDGARARFNLWTEQLRIQLGLIGANPINPDVNSPDVQDLLREYNAKARNLADAIALTSIDGFGDPSNPSNADRLVYNRSDPRAAGLVDPADARWAGRTWAQLKPDEQAILLRENFDRVVSRYVMPDGALTEAAQIRIDILRELTGGALGEVDPGHRAIAERVVQVADLNDIDLSNRSASSVIDQFRGSFVDGLDQSLVAEVLDVRATGQSLDLRRAIAIGGLDSVPINRIHRRIER